MKTTMPLSPPVRLRRLAGLACSRGMNYLLSALLTATLSQPVSAANGVQRDTSAKRPLTSFVERRDRGVVRQRKDYSCGAAALATLLAHQWGDSVSELDVLTTLSLILPQDELSRRSAEGLSLLDLSRVARARGYRSQGFRLLPEQLSQLTGPVIVYIEPQGNEHFSVFKGVVNGRAFLADPSYGNISYPLYRFLDMWVGDSGTGNILAITPLRAEVNTLSVGVLAPPSREHTYPALSDIRSLLPFSALDVATRRSMR